MKTLFHILSLTFFSLPSFTFAQDCTRSIPAFMAAPGGYNISGTGLLEAAQEGTTLSFDQAFNTQSGPDLHVYLSINFEAPTTPGNTNIDIGELTSNQGAQSYTIPSNVALGDYNYVLIHCKSFNHWWGGGLLGEINCVSATNNADANSSPSVFPNPASDVITISIPGHDIQRITIMNLFGQVVMNQNISGQDEIQTDISKLNFGMYILTGVNSAGEIVLTKPITRL